MRKNYLLFMMGGIGTRAQKDLPKQYVLVNGVPIFAYTLKTYDKLDFIDGIIIVADSYYFNYINKWINKLDIKKVIKIVQGGKIRSESVLNGIKGYENIAKDKDILLVHDASSPYVDAETIRKGICETKKGYFVTLGTRESVTVYQINEKDQSIENIIPREKVVPGACPDIFDYKRIHDIYVGASFLDLEKITSAIALGIEKNVKSKVVLTPMLPIKITYSDDIKIFRKLVDTYYFPDFKEKYIDLLETEKDLIV